MINRILDTAVVHSEMGKPLYDFGKNAVINDEFHKAACIQEAWQEAEYSDESEIEELNMLEHFLSSAPIGKDLSKAVIDDVGNYVPEGWSYV